MEIPKLILLQERRITDLISLVEVTGDIEDQLNIKTENLNNIRNNLRQENEQLIGEEMRLNEQLENLSKKMQQINRLLAENSADRSGLNDRYFRLIRYYRSISNQVNRISGQIRDNANIMNENMEETERLINQSISLLDFLDYIDEETLAGRSEEMTRNINMQMTLHRLDNLELRRRRAS